jgi:hypothetical protein
MTESDADFFFGRGRETADIAKQAEWNAPCRLERADAAGAHLG